MNSRRSKSSALLKFSRTFNERQAAPITLARSCSERAFAQPRARRCGSGLGPVGTQWERTTPLRRAGLEPSFLSRFRLADQRVDSSIRAGFSDFRHGGHGPSVGRAANLCLVGRDDSIPHPPPVTNEAGVGLLMNGWFKTNPSQWPPHPADKPIYLGFHIRLFNAAVIVCCVVCAASPSNAVSLVSTAAPTEQSTSPAPSPRWRSQYRYDSPRAGGVAESVPNLTLRILPEPCRRIWDDHKFLDGIFLDGFSSDLEARNV